jgi:hypothetical protein
MDPMQDQPSEAPGEYVTFTVNFDHTSGGTGNDFAVFEIAFSTTIYDLWKRGDRTFKDSPDFIKKDVEEGMADIKETFAKFIHLPADGQLALISAADACKNDDDDRWYSATDYTAGSTSAMLKLDATAIARIGPGQRLDFYTGDGANLIMADVRCSDVHPFDNTICVELIANSTLESNGSTPATTLNTLNNAVEASATTNLEIYLRDSVGSAPSGTLSALFDIDNHANYYGVGRVKGGTGYIPKNRVLAPYRVDISAGGAAQPLTADHFRRVGEVASHAAGAWDAKVNLAMVMSNYEYRSVASFVKDEGITLTPALESDVGRKLNKAFGYDGFILHDPTFGTAMMAVDDFAEPGQIDFLNRSQWEQATPIDGGFRMFPGDIGGIWSRNLESTGTRPGKTYSANGLLLSAFVCRWPKGQVRLMGLSTS